MRAQFIAAAHARFWHIATSSPTSVTALAPTADIFVKSVHREMQSAISRESPWAPVAFRVSPIATALL
jgi:hypothetical protein